MKETENLFKKKKKQTKKMAKKKGNLYGVSNYHKRTPKKRKGRISKKVGPRARRRKKYVGQGHQ